ncbi:elongation of very long chain fatty acids protein 6-like [Anneissia japonica]|uniref:elongation of very long chain fatty acids protein 6-like n=1 Tax=Anneissia japonica TaxID=1529436 RepID=UPI0014256219|nr:elongation of very long chain fatty acids protein 6-like [Anneissia japonica]
MLDDIDPIFQQTKFSFEEDFHAQKWLDWFENYWTLSIIASVIYVVVIFSIQRLMKYRERFNLRPALILWSLSLAVFSTVCAWRLWTEYLLYYRKFGLKATMCDEQIGYHGVNGFWSLMFVLSKLPELGDTLFIVLRKQPLIFLHWYHHITVFVYSWYSYQYMVAPGRYFIGVNCTVHAVMYSYYTLRASRLFKIPRFINVCITLFQMSQMVVGVTVNYLAYRFRSRGEHCSTTDINILVALLMYASYLVLFAHYFYKAYISRSTKPTSTKNMEVNGNGVHSNGTALHLKRAHLNGNGIKVD